MIVIIGGGLAGLTCAKVLREHSVDDFLLLEAGETCGGRLATDLVNGFVLDRGFQVLLDNYPMVKKHLHLRDLQPCYFDSGALLATSQGLRRLCNPLRHPSRAWEALVSSAVPFPDKTKLSVQVLELMLARDRQLLEPEEDVSTMDYLVMEGYREETIERFFRPFFGGVFLDNALGTSFTLFEYYLRKFALGRSLLPRHGIAAIPRQLYCHLKSGQVRTRCRVARLHMNERSVKTIQLENGDQLEPEHVVLAVEAQQAGELINDPEPEGAEAQVFYFQGTTPLYEDPLIVLPEGRNRLARHFTDITNVNPAAAPAGKRLISATVLGKPTAGTGELFPRVAAEIAGIFPAAEGTLEPLANYHLVNALPCQLPREHRHRLGANGRLPKNVILAGDHTLQGSVQGAMESGERAAVRLLHRLGVKGNA